MIVNLVSESTPPRRVLTADSAKIDGRRVRKYQPLPGYLESVLAVGHLRVVAAHQSRSLWN